MSEQDEARRDDAAERRSNAARADAEWTAESEDDRGVLSMHTPIMREHTEPSEGYEPLPVWLIFIFLGLAGWGGWYIGQYSGGWRADIYSEAPGDWVRFSEGRAAQKEPEPVDFDTLGRRVFSGCAACHQANGEGVKGQYPPLVDSEWVLGSPGTLARILLHGLSGPIEVAGETYNDNMPAWGARLDDRQIAAVLTHIRTEWGNQASEVSPDLVAKVREQHSGRASAWSADELKAAEREAQGQDG